MNKNAAVVLSILLVFVVSLSYGQVPGVITVEGAMRTPLKLSLPDLKTFAQTQTNAKDKDGKEHLFKGVRLVDILDSAGVSLGKQLRGDNLAKYVLIKALDSYQVIFALPEIDPEFTNQTILIAYEVDGKLLPEGEGPFRLIVPNDKKHARWIRQVASIKILFTKD